MSTNLKAADIKVVIGNRVRQLRKATRITQQELADRCGMFRTYISRIENGTANPSLQVLADLAELFGISVSQLISEAPSALDLQGVPLADKRALLGFSLNWLQLMSQEDGQDARHLARYQAQLCSVCNQSRLYACDAGANWPRHCALATADISQTGDIG